MSDDLPVLSVSDATSLLREIVESTLPFVWVEGEITNCTQARSGHIYLTLKDDYAQMSAVVWRTTAQRLKFDVTDGMRVVAGGPIQVYPARGVYQLIVEKLLPQGVGPLELAFRQLKEKLEREGLFNPDRKRPIPKFPKRNALITSPSGAAVHDILQVMRRRWPPCNVIILPVAVQGDYAPREIAGALRSVHRVKDVDVVICGRGGGSLEDLWAFNEEVVARAIAACKIPVVSAVGHEVDVTIAGMVADRRALTPSEPAELVVPVHADVMAGLEQLAGRLRKGLLDRANEARRSLESLASRPVLQDPRRLIHDREERLDLMSDRLNRSIRHMVDRTKSKLAGLSDSLDALSPLKVLGRGYSITRMDSGEIIRGIDGVSPGMQVETQFGDGRIVSEVREVSPRDNSLSEH